MSNRSAHLLLSQLAEAAASSSAPATSQPPPSSKKRAPSASHEDTPKRPRRRANLVARAQIAAASREQLSRDSSEMPLPLPRGLVPSSRLGDSSDDNSDSDHLGRGPASREAKAPRKPRRTPHSVIEKRRREKINTAYEELRSLILDPDKPARHKLHILKTSIDYIRSLKDENDRLKSGHMVVPAVQIPPSLDRSTSTDDTLYDSSLPSSRFGSALTTPDLHPIAESGHGVTPTPMALDREQQQHHHTREHHGGAIPVMSLLC